MIIPWAGRQMEGTTVDLSEAGMRALVDGWGVPMESGTTTQLTLDVDDALIHLKGEIVWTVERGAQWLMAMKFLDVPEKAADLLRRRVFQALRDERAAQASALTCGGIGPCPRPSSPTADVERSHSTKR